jgi:hypothetical protein
MEMKHPHHTKEHIFFYTGNTVFKSYPKKYPDWGSLWFSFVIPAECPNCTLDKANTVSLHVFSGLYNARC